MTVSFEAGEAGCLESVRAGRVLGARGRGVWAMCAKLCTLSSLGGALMGLGGVELLLPRNPGHAGLSAHL